MKQFLIGCLLWAFCAFSAFAQQQTRLCYITGTQSNVQNCVPGIQAESSIAINISSMTTTQLVAAITGQAIYITSWDVIAGGTGNFTLVYGTGSVCATGQTALTGAYNLIAQVGISKGNGLGMVLYVPQGNALCAITSASVQYSGSLSYAQF